MKNNYAICYDTLYVFEDKKELEQYFKECYFMSEGAEQQRYASIIIGLLNNDVGLDNVSLFCDELCIRKHSGTDDFINLILKDRLSINESINFFEDKIMPVLKISDKYNIYFNNEVPFEDFSCDDENVNSLKFSEYYKELFDYFDINVNEISTNFLSDGKYELLIDDKRIELTAWDSLQKVIENVDMVIELNSKEVEM